MQRTKPEDFPEWDMKPSLWREIKRLLYTMACRLLKVKRPSDGYR